MAVFPIRLGALLSRLLSLQNRPEQIHGIVSSLPVAAVFAVAPPSEILQRPNLLVFPDEDSCDDFELHLRFFDPGIRAHRLFGFDVSPYSQLYPNSRVLGQRLGWLWRAQNARPGDLFIAPISALLQNTLPKSTLRNNSLLLKVGMDLPPDFQRRLSDWGYSATPRTEDLGQCSIRGGILDVFSPAHDFPIRVELVGDTIESLRLFDPETQRSVDSASFAQIIPAREILFGETSRSTVADRLEKFLLEERKLSEKEAVPLLHEASLGRFPQGIDFLIEVFHGHLESPAQHFSGALNILEFDPIEITRTSDQIIDDLAAEAKGSSGAAISPSVEKLFSKWSSVPFPDRSCRISLARIRVDEHALSEEAAEPAEYRTSMVRNFLGPTVGRKISEEQLRIGKEKLTAWHSQGYFIAVSSHTQSQAQRIALQLEQMGCSSQILDPQTEIVWEHLFESSHNEDASRSRVEDSDRSFSVPIIPRRTGDSFVSHEDHLVILREEDFLGRKTVVRQTPQGHLNPDHVRSLQFGDIKPGDYVVHVDHGVGVFEGLKIMPVQGVEAEFVQIRYKDNDRLYLPIYRVAQIQKYSGVGVLDKLGGTSWQKAKVKVQHHLRDMASELLRLYANRSKVQRQPFSQIDDDYRAFEDAFPFDETPDQTRAITDIMDDLSRLRPADRLVCGDVGFGKTEVAMRAAFRVARDRRLVCVLVPTTVLALQHLETFRKRFNGWPLRIEGLSRFTEKAAGRKIVEDLRDGKVDIIIGTHRLLSKDVVLKNLGLLVIDEEQKFGVAHKEKIKKMMVDVDTIVLTATPIPRTLNLSLVGIRDLSLINSAPQNRVPTRTFICRYEEETVKKAILSEVQRGGQVFFLHNRVQSIYETSAQIRELVPDVRIAVAHGQMEEGELEKTMVAFYHHEYDVLICTTIIESGVDIPSANTIIIDRADTFGLSQLYQLRGRVGRGKDRAYCYLLIPRSGNLDPIAQERLKAIQEHTALGSGYIIANHDLELRGAGNILGEAQSGHINAVGYELYLELLQDALSEAKGEVDSTASLEPEINLRIPALIPDSYVPDIRIRLSYYKLLSGVKAPEDLDAIEAELTDQFGPPPQPVLNLMGVMLIRRNCKELGIRDLSGTPAAISLAFTEKTSVPPQVVVGLVSREQKKYSLTPDNRLIVRTDGLSWPTIYEEVLKIRKLIR